MADFGACAACRPDRARRLFRRRSQRTAWRHALPSLHRRAANPRLQEWPKPDRGLSARGADLRALSADAAALVRSNVSVLVTQGTEPGLQAALGATRTLPIVMIAANYDPLARGYVKSLARPDGNVTGVFLRQTELAEKQTELLWQAFPDRTRLGILWDAISVEQFNAAERRAKIFGLQVHSLKLENPPYDIESAFRALAAA